MMVFEIPAGSGSAGVRGVSLGSCRVRDPLIALSRAGGLRLCSRKVLSTTHSTGEALQTLKIVMGERSVPDFLYPFIFADAAAPDLGEPRRLLSGEPEAILLEVSDDKQFIWREFALQQNFLSIRLVQAHRGALLAWYRQVSRGEGPADAAVVQAAVDNLRRGGTAPDDNSVDLLREVRLERRGVGEMTQDIRAMMVAVGGRWTLIGAFEVPGMAGPIMQERRALNVKLRAVADELRLPLWQATDLIGAHGRATALDDGGADIYEFAPAFFPVVAEALTTLARAGSPTATPIAELKAPTQLADTVSVALAEVYRPRSGALGVDGSGLYDHYQQLLERNALVGLRERAVLELIDRYLPPYDTYCVMKAGVGELALLLAAAGRRTIACEPHDGRRAAIEAAAEHLERLGLIGAGKFSVAARIAPSAPPGGNALGVGLDVAQVTSEASAQVLLDRLVVFDALLVDLRILFRLREDPGEREQLAFDLAREGFERRRDYPRESLSWFRRRQI